MFGVSGSGKTCYLHAMSQVFNNGVSMNGTSVSVIANNMEQQDLLNRGFLRMVRGQWPQPSQNTTPFDFAVRVQSDECSEDIIPSLIFLDYRGGIWEIVEDDEDEEEKRRKECEDLLNQLCDNAENGEYTTSILFMIDGCTLLNAMDMLDKDPEHRNFVSLEDQVAAQQQISFMENLFRAFKRQQQRTQQEQLHGKNQIHIPPILVVITKADVFSSEDELEKAKLYIKRKLPSLFAKGSKVWAGITHVSLGQGLTNVNNQLAGQLDITTNHNIHIPIIFSLYAYLSEVEGDEEDMRMINALLPTLRKMMSNRMDLYSNGYIALEVK